MRRVDAHMRTILLYVRHTCVARARAKKNGELVCQLGVRGVLGDLIQSIILVVLFKFSV